MVFTSEIFVFYFLPLTLAAYYALAPRWRNGFLALASYAFYGWWNPWFVLLMLGSTLVDYQCGRLLARPGTGARPRRRLLLTSVTVNLSLLGFFKYWIFFTDNVNQVLAAAGVSGIPTLEVILPVGISFYTFQSMSYTIDLYRGRVQPARSLVDFAAYVALFPQLVAGPIVRYRDLATQLGARRHGLDKLASGMATFVLGFAKKLILANNVGEIADLAFAADRPVWHLAWIGVIAYAFQIYFDFSGYSDMAIGLGLMLGFRFPQNFDAPYRAESITDFWRRWHISLSTWLRDYLYVPLGGNRKGPRRTYLNLAITMLLGGLWHGAEWRFVVWGALHGGLLAAERATGRRSLYPGLPRPLRVLLTFVLVLITWVFFRAASLGDAVRYLGSMFAVIPPSPASALLHGAVYGTFPMTLLALAAIIVAQRYRTRDLVGGEHGDHGGGIVVSPLGAALVAALFVLGVAEMLVQGHNPFLYFQF